MILSKVALHLLHKYRHPLVNLGTASLSARAAMIYVSGAECLAFLVVFFSILKPAL